MNLSIISIHEVTQKEWDQMNRRLSSTGLMIGIYPKHGQQWSTFRYKVTLDGKLSAGQIVDLMEREGFTYSHIENHAYYEGVKRMVFIQMVQLPIKHEKVRLS